MSDGLDPYTAEALTIRRLSPSLTLIEDICNVYAIIRGSRALLIDSGSGRSVAALAALGVEQIDWVLHTHFHRDQCDGSLELASRGTRIAAPAAELGYFDAGLFWHTKAIFDNYNTYNDFSAPLASIRIDRALEDYSVFSWEDLEFRVVPAPGHTKGSIALVSEIDGRRVAFTGDTIHHSERPWTIFDLEWDYGSHAGVDALSLTLRTLATLSLDLMFPSHGNPIAAPAASCRSLIRRLGSYHEWLYFCTTQVAVKQPPLSAETRLQPITPHLWMNATSFANSYALVNDDGSAMFLDYGFPSYAHFSANYRFVDHMLEDLRRLAGLRTLEVVLPSHYHDDHVCGLQYLHEHHGAELWVFENQEDILSHPEAYKIPCLWPRPMAAGKVLKDGEVVHWHDIAFTATRTPGHTAYHCAVFFELDGLRIAHAGDTLGRGSEGPRLGGPIFQNRFAPEDFVESMTKLRDFEPDYVLTGHWGALRVTPPYLDEALRRARALADIVTGLAAVPNEAGFAYDPNWATLYPYQSTMEPGATLEIEVRIVNHRSGDTEARVALRLPDGWHCAPPMGVQTIPYRGQGTIRFAVTVAGNAPSGSREMIAAVVALDDRSFGPVAEGIVRIAGAPRS